MLIPPLQLGITVTASLYITAANCRQSTNFANGPRISTIAKKKKVQIFEAECDEFNVVEIMHRIGSLCCVNIHVPYSFS
jgi:hypothetical protein